MGLPARFKTVEELEASGFELLSEKLAKHKRFNSFRYKCDGCGEWVKHLQGKGVGVMFCDRCFVKPEIQAKLDKLWEARMAHKEEVWQEIKTRRHVSFVELQALGDWTKGDVWIGNKERNIWLWFGCSEELASILKELQSEGKIEVSPCPEWVYFIDGRVPDLEIAKRVYHYKKPHWLPVVFNPTSQALEEAE